MLVQSILQVLRKLEGMASWLQGSRMEELHDFDDGKGSPQVEEGKKSFAMEM